MITLVILSFIAGVLTVAAPCILPLLPIVIGGSVIESAKDNRRRQWLRPLVIAASLAVSVIVFTLLIKATTTLLGVPQYVWQLISGGIVLLLGANYLWPQAWEHIAIRLSIKSSTTLGNAQKHQGLSGAILIGAALGPVFSSCSPTYALIVATILPVSFAEGLVYLIAYAIGMSAILLLVAYLGRAFVSRLKWLSNPNGWFKRTIGVLFIVVGLFILFGLDKDLQTYVLDQGWYAPISNLEERLR